MKDRLFEALKSNAGDYAEIRITSEDKLSFRFRGRDTEQVESRQHTGGLVRVCKKGGWGIVSFDSLDNLADKVREASECAALIGKEKTELAEVAPVCIEKPAMMQRDFRDVSLDDKIKLIGDYNRLMLERHPAIQSTSTGYSESFRTVYFASSTGTYFKEERPMVGCFCSAIAKAENMQQHAHDVFISNNDYGALLDREEEILIVADRAVALLKAPQCPGGPQTVVLDQDMGGLFVHEAFGHLSEADFLYENPRMREMMRLGREIGSKGLNIIDDGTLPNGTGTHMLDDEGTLSSHVPLVTDGIITAHLHSRETAAKMGERPTGNARAVNSNHPPIVRMRNTFIANGPLTKEKLLAGIDHGVYVCGCGGGQTAMEMFSFSAECAYRIENGKVGELLRDTVLTGNVFETLKNIDGIANDLVFDPSGGCGKGRQYPLPCDCASPHLRIRNVVIGGKQ